MWLPEPRPFFLIRTTMAGAWDLCFQQTQHSKVLLLTMKNEKVVSKLLVPLYSPSQGDKGESRLMTVGLAWVWRRRRATVRV